MRPANTHGGGRQAGRVAAACARGNCRLGDRHGSAGLQGRFLAGFAAGIGPDRGYARKTNPDYGTACGGKGGTVRLTGAGGRAGGRAAAGSGGTATVPAAAAERAGGSRPGSARGGLALRWAVPAALAGGLALAAAFPPASVWLSSGRRCSRWRCGAGAYGLVSS